jgi:hypothetical protein
LKYSQAGGSLALFGSVVCSMNTGSTPAALALRTRSATGSMIDPTPLTS